MFTYENQYSEGEFFICVPRANSQISRTFTYDFRLIDQGEAEGGGIQLCILHAETTAADTAAGQETLQDRDPPPGDMLHHLLEQRPRSRLQGR